jgi:hypothetical protein
MNVPIPPAQVFENLELFIPLDQKFPVSLHNRKFVLEIIALASQAIRFRPIISLLPANNLPFFFYLLSLRIDHSLLIHPP